MKNNVLYNKEYTLENQSTYSYFNFDNTFQVLLNKSIESKKIGFCQFVNSRNIYLDKLRTIGDNWISGTSNQPTSLSIDLAISFLENLNLLYEKELANKFIAPKIIMGPTPMGGVGMEIEIYPSLKMYLTILNEDFICEIENDGFFMEQKVDKTSALATLMNLYTQYERGYYSERRNFV